MTKEGENMFCTVRTLGTRPHGHFCDDSQESGKHGFCGYFVYHGFFLLAPVMVDISRDIA